MKGITDMANAVLSCVICNRPIQPKIFPSGRKASPNQEAHMRGNEQEKKDLRDGSMLERAAAQRGTEFRVPPSRHVNLTG